MKPPPFEVAVVAAPWHAAGLDVFWSQEDNLPLDNDPPVVVYGRRADGKPRLNAAQRRLGPWIRLPDMDYVVVDLTANVYGMSLQAWRARLHQIVSNTYGADVPLADAILKHMARRKIERVIDLPEADVRMFAFWSRLIWHIHHEVPRV